MSWKCSWQNKSAFKKSISNCWPRRKFDHFPLQTDDKRSLNKIHWLHVCITTKAKLLIKIVIIIIKVWWIAREAHKKWKQRPATITATTVKWINRVHIHWHQCRAILTSCLLFGFLVFYSIVWTQLYYFLLFLICNQKHLFPLDSFRKYGLLLSLMPWQSDSVLQLKCMKHTFLLVSLEKLWEFGLNYCLSCKLKFLISFHFINRRTKRAAQRVNMVMCRFELNVSPNFMLILVFLLYFRWNRFGVFELIVFILCPIFGQYMNVGPKVSKWNVWLFSHRDTAHS